MFDVVLRRFGTGGELIFVSLLTSSSTFFSTFRFRFVCGRVALTGHNLEMSLKVALEKVERKEFKQAKELLEPICNVSKKRWRAWTLLSLVYLSMDEPKKAYEASNVASGKNAPLAEYVKTKAMYILDMDNKLEQLEHALEIDCDCLYTLKLASCLPEVDGAILLEKSARTKASQTET